MATCRVSHSSLAFRTLPRRLLRRLLGREVRSDAIDASQHPDAEVPQPDPARSTKIIVAALVAAVAIIEVLAVHGTLIRSREDSSHTVRYSITGGDGVLVAFRTGLETARDVPAEMPWSYTTTLSDGDTYYLWARSLKGGTACSVSVDGVVVTSTNGKDRICTVSGRLPASPEPQAPQKVARARASAS